MKIEQVITYLESIAPTTLQESYDNAGLLTGNLNWECTGMLCTLDATEGIVQEAIDRNCNLIIAHHPIIFTGLKKINGKNYVERAVILAIKNDVAIYAIHTNLDNILTGVNGKMADLLGLINRKVLSSKPSSLKKLFTFVPADHIEAVRMAVFAAGAGHISNYSECSFAAEGVGTFKGDQYSSPYVGEPGKRHYENEMKLEMVFAPHSESAIITALKTAHPYEEVAYDIVELSNPHPGIGSGLIGELPNPMADQEFLDLLLQQFKLRMIRHTALLNRHVKKIALCGGAGSFLVSKALAQKADVYVTADMKYHEFFDADGRLVICDIGHYESEQFTPHLLADILRRKFPTFAVLKSDLQTNPVHYYF